MLVLKGPLGLLQAPPNICLNDTRLMHLRPIALRRPTPPHYRRITLLESHPHKSMPVSFLVNKLPHHQKLRGYTGAGTVIPPRTNTIFVENYLKMSDCLAKFFSLAPWRGTGCRLCYLRSMQVPCSMASTRVMTDSTETQSHQPGQDFPNI